MPRRLQLKDNSSDGEICQKFNLDHIRIRKQRENRTGYRYIRCWYRYRYRYNRYRNVTRNRNYRYDINQNGILIIFVLKET
jgi:hypothetical protein